MTETEKNKEIKTESAEELENKEEICHKKVCRERFKRLVEIEKENTNLKKNFLTEHRKKMYLLKENIKMYANLWGKDIFKSIDAILEKDKRNEYEKAPKLKDEEGKDIKCFGCKNSIAIGESLKGDFFKSYDKNWYCFECYENKYPAEFDKKLKEFYSAKDKEKEIELKLNNHSILKHSTRGEAKIDDASVIFIRDKKGLGIYRSIVGVMDDGRRKILTNQVESEGIDPTNGYDLQLFVDGKLVGNKKLEEDDVHQKVELKINGHLAHTGYDEMIDLNDVKIERGEKELKFAIGDKVTFTFNRETLENDLDYLNLEVFVKDKLIQHQKYSITTGKREDIK